ncbi:MAG: nucleotide sugar dehydrogenase, partial [Spirochaetes bacterium]|nr:nucleotide sugar dehydrogenase [Spirochaetota bacterium]
DFMHPDRIVIGVESKKAAEVLTELYRPLKAKIVVTDINSAELIKHASNSFLATKISFINAVSQICERTGADIIKVAEGMGFDRRIGRQFLDAGVGYGGSCFPKDTIALVKTGKLHDYDFKIIQSAIEINKEQKIKFFRLIEEYYKSSLDNKTFAVWGLAFKPNTDDMREAPSIDILRSLLKYKVKIRAFDPVAKKEALKLFPDIEYAGTPYEAVDGCDALIILTEWNEFKQVDVSKLKKLLKHPVIFDGRNVYDPQIMQENKIDYISIGRKAILF